MASTRSAPKRVVILAAAAVAAIVAAPASAHITFEAKEVSAGATAKFALRVPHGCAGAATTAVRISIPDALSEAKPQPKPGWTLALARAEPDGNAATPASHGGHGGQEDAKVVEIVWSGGRLEDAYNDEFVFHAKVDGAAAGERIFVPIVQECEKGVERWIEVPPSGGSSGALKFPAPSVKVVPSP